MNEVTMYLWGMLTGMMIVRFFDGIELHISANFTEDTTNDSE